MKKSPMKLPAVLVALAMFTAACGGDDSDDASTDSGSSTVEASDDSGADAEADFDLSTSEESDATAEPLGRVAPTEAEAGAAVDQEAMADDAMADDSTAPSQDRSDDGFFGGSTDAEAPDARETENNTFRDYGIRPFVSTDRDPLSTFALDVDTASYAIAREWLNSGAIPPPEAVRVEEFVNSFGYDYRAPRDGLAVEADGGPSPFDQDNVIVRLGVQAEQVANSDRPDASLTFVVDTSGSMDRSNRLGLVKTSLVRLTSELGRSDTVAIVTYSDNASVVLPPTSVGDRDTIIEAIESLRPTGSTNLEAGLQRGYDLANESFTADGINRVILASDGVANVGLTDPDGLARLIRGDADRGIQLVTVGVGMGNFNDVVLEQLADQGDGFYAYVNDEREANKLFSDDLVSTLLTVALDGKIQVEFNPEAVEQYRLIGFENRAVLDDDFRNDAVDAGELGAGHQVTALYELTLRPGVSGRDQLGTAQLRWEDPEERSVRETRLVLTANIIEDRWVDTAEDFRLAVTVGAFAEVLRQSPYLGDVSLDQAADEAESLSPGSGPIAELADLVRAADRRQ